MTQTEIVAKVLALLNEISAADDTDTELLTEDTVQLEEYIISVLPEAVSLIQAASPSRAVNAKAGDSVSTTLTPDEDGVCTLTLPEDYVRLVALKLAEWKRVCVTAWPMDSEEYRRQCHPYTRAGVYKPVCILGYNADGDRVLWLYSATASTTLDIFLYEAQYNSSDGLNLEADDPLALAVCYMAAGLVYNIFENPTTSQRMRELAVSLIPQA